MNLQDRDAMDTHTSDHRDPGSTHHSASTSAHGGHGGHGGHGLMMIVCCVPMLLLAVALVATGVAGSGILSALLCAAMMAAMMFMMRGRHGGQ